MLINLSNVQYQFSSVSEEIATKNKMNQVKSNHQQINISKMYCMKHSKWEIIMLFNKKLFSFKSIGIIIVDDGGDDTMNWPDSQVKFCLISSPKYEQEISN